MDAKWKRFLVLFLVLGLGALALSACQAMSVEEATEESDAALDDDGTGEQEDAGEPDASDLSDVEEFGPLEFQQFLEGQGLANEVQFDVYDLDADGVLSEDEYNEMVQDLGVEAGELLEDTGAADAEDEFLNLDANQDNFLDESEFLTLLQRAGRAGQAELDAYDLDADGVLSEDEYSDMLQDLGIEEGELIEGAEDTTSD